MKLAVNALVHAINVALSESLVLAEAGGVERSLAYEVFASSAAGSPAERSTRRPRVAADLYSADARLAAAKSQFTRLSKNVFK